MDLRTRNTLYGEESLAAFVAGLHDGSPCFCCGKSMRAMSGLNARTGSAVFLMCPACGSEVALAGQGIVGLDMNGGRRPVRARR